MTRLKKFTSFSLRDLVASAGPTILGIAVVCIVAYLVVDPAPPRHVVLGTGQENSAYDVFGKRYQELLKKERIAVALQGSHGSRDNLKLLKEGKVDIAFMQSGTTDEAAPEREGLVSLGSLFTEPVWLFLRAKEGAPAITQLTQLRGLKINIGARGSGTPRLVRQILEVNGVDRAELQTTQLDNTPATVELLEGRIDGLVFAAAPDDPLIQMLLQTPGIVLFDFAQAEAYTRRLPFLTHVTLPRGIVDLGRDLPARDYHLIAPTATLVARDDLHPALVELFVQAAAKIHGGAGWFQQQGQFPSAKYTEIRVADEAAKYYKDGAPFLQRYMSFWLANFLDRMWVLLLALSALILPLSKIVPPLYVWRVRSRIYRWYGQLRTVEGAIEEAVEVPPEERGAIYAAQLERLNEIEDRVNHLSIPLSFADDLYGLRSHVHFVRQRIVELMGGAVIAGPVDT
ncbi:TAXI family TRAP transporter solute-binding subunit [Pseudoduganella lutea]|uniref:C4-dicarboxylate ABC transporter substrate-binding protein n=1 Tax=Pseudoduganella lutea TaxID=321985 RepID=A0A4P6L630_9BURK|nr:TAXI family TRAP transporter solute-binding subunit [Pseudoduganella lutea]QBE67151.1 C4-dicarboxylate ABC transporter substrate-binding protein [Pseudoduganella lutea]